MRVSMSIAVVIIVATPSASIAQPSEGEQRSACMADAFWLCLWDIPDRQKIISCMALKRDQLSPGCLVVFDASTSPNRIVSIRC